MSFFRKSGIVNVKMVITEEKIASNIDKIQKLINPNSKKQIVQLEEDSYFRDLVESVKNYLIEYPKKKTFPKDVYKAAYDLVEYATNQFEENTRKVEELIRKREKNIKLANILGEVEKVVKAKSKNYKEIIKKVNKKYPEDVVEALKTISTEESTSEEYQKAEKLIEAKIANLEANMFIEIDMERIEDRSKALSYIGIEIAEALKYIPAPVDAFVSETETETEATPVVEVEKESTEEVTNNVAAFTKEEENKSTSELLKDVITDATTEEFDTEEDAAASFFEETRFEEKPSLWQRIKNSKFVRTVKYIMQIKVVLDYPALPEGRGEEL